MVGCHATGCCSFDTWKVCIAMVSEVVRDAHDSIVLPEVSVDNFVHAWKRFRLPGTAKQCQEEKQLQILPTFMRGVVAVSTIKEVLGYVGPYGP